MRNAYVVTGTLTDNYTVELDEALPLMSKKVRVVVEPLATSSRLPYDEVISKIRARQLARGHRPPTRQQVDANIQAERESWGE